MANQVYVPEKYRDKWQKAIRANYINIDNLNVTEVGDGVILPLVRCNDYETLDGVFKGGVCNKNGEFVAGIIRNRNKVATNMSCFESYDFEDKDILKRDEEVVFGGVLIPHFGHMMVDCMSRMWWFIEHRNENRKYVFLQQPGVGEFKFKEFFYLLGMKDEQLEIITQPTRFRNIIIPDESCHSLSGTSLKWKSVFDEIVTNVNTNYEFAKYSKVYLTRSAFVKKEGDRDGYNEGINEEFYEQFFARRGYKILSPEKLPLPEQIYIIAHADELVCTMGTLSHLTVFAKDGLKCLFLLRVADELVWPQLIINCIRNLDCSIVLGTKNLLPVTHTVGTYLYHPTRELRLYLDSNNIEYIENEIDFPLTNEIINDYICSWAKVFSNTKEFSAIKGKDMYDVVYALNCYLLDNNIDSSDFPSNPYKLTIVKQKEKIKKMQYEIKKILKSKSWRITKPLRWIFSKLK